MIEKIIDILSDKLYVEKGKITPESLLIGDLGMDSLDGVEIVMAIEDEFHIEIPDEDIESIHTVQELIDYITMKQTGA